MAPRRFEIELRRELVQKVIARAFGDSHCAITLNITVAADRTESCTRFADLPTQQHEIHYFLNIADGVLMLRQSHGPANDRPVGFDKDPRSGFDVAL